MSISKFDRKTVQPENRSRVFLKRCAMFFFMQFTVFVALMFSAPSARANDIYLSQSGGGSGSSCSSALPVSFFNNSSNWGTQIVPGTTVHLCGTITGTAGQTLLTFQGSGTSGAPITLLFETGAVLQAPYFKQALGGSAGGAITMNGQSWIVVDGNNQTGTIRNTSNGSSSATCTAGPCTSSAPSTLIAMFSCSNCTVKNLKLPNVYVASQNDSTQANSTNEHVITVSGSNNTVSGNAFTNCGWCVNFFYGNNDTNFQAYNNTFINFGHAFAVAAAGGSNACLAPCSIIHDNHIGPAGTNWDAAGCPNHKDGIHYFGSGAGSTMDGTYVYNNLFDGDWGVCPTGFVYSDNPGSSPGMKSWYFWNNVGIIVNTKIVNTNGWFGMGGNPSPSGQQFSLNNTLIGTGLNDNTLGFGFGDSASLTVHGNVTSGIGDPVYIGSTVTIASIDYNFYGGSTCQNTGNCFVWHGSFSGSFAGWKANCGCDAHSALNLTPLLNPDGSPQAGSPVIKHGLNLGSMAGGLLAPLANDTSKGATRTMLARPAPGTCSTMGGSSCWDIGAYSYSSASSSSSVNPTPPSGLVATVQ